MERYLEEYDDYLAFLCQTPAETPHNKDSSHAGGQERTDESQHLDVESKNKG